MTPKQIWGGLVALVMVGAVLVTLGVAAIVGGGGFTGGQGAAGTADSSCTNIENAAVDVGPLNGLVPLMAEARDFTYQTWPQIKTIGGYADRNIGSTGTPSDHSLGLAIDIMTTDVALGNEIAEYFATGPGHERFNVDNTIWNYRIHNDAGGWHTYDIPPGGSPHTDHVHVDTFTSELGAPAPADNSEAADVTATTIAGLDPVQTRNATIIVHEAQKLGVSTEGATIAIAVSLVEAELRNLASQAIPESLNYPHDTYADGSTPGGDHDSVGAFQQRANWASVKSRMDVAASAHRFFNGGSTKPDGWEEPGLLDTPGWENMDFSLAANTVQVSQYPDRYGDQAEKAAAIVAQVGGKTVEITCDTVENVANTGPSKDGVDGDWTQPLDKGTYSVNVDSFGSYDGHTGVDLTDTDPGQPIYAAAAGTVTTSEFVTRSDGSPSYGWLVVLDNGGGVETYYAHQIREPPVNVGDKVEVGDRIGAVGSTGNSTGDHLHLEVRVNGSPVDPVPFFAEHGAPL